MKTVCVIGNFSGRNAGDNAILENLLIDVSKQYPNTRFTVPTISEKFVNRAFGRFAVTAVPLMPWNASLKIFGVPTFRAILNSDLVLVTDAVLFDHKFWNPIFNYLSTLSLALPVARRKGIPVVLYNGSIGPIKRTYGENALRKVINSMETVIVRDPESIALLERLGIHHDRIILGADCALNTPVAEAGRIREICRKEGIAPGKSGLISVNINSYIDTFMKKPGEGFGADAFKQTMAEILDKTIENLDVNLVFVVTQVMDSTISHEVVQRMANRRRVSIVTNKKYTHNEIAGILSKADVHVGMRTHSIILASATGTPVVCIVYRPKNRGYMQTIEQSDKSIEIEQFRYPDRLYRLIRRTFDDRENVRAKLKPVILREKENAWKSVGYLRRYLS
jgi:polysaccharide pyruvyl transferase WcaK-like protein